ncbi:homoserine kinase [Caminicella sporogenes]|uniref:homoserine kinase n=1 Tax=Caminicella sporogenes TaxID=166485 RepID=UPI0025416ADF|nr:homoserine kinase [Caminicella sporogenes]WIF96135.1 homoserine kinase [Caminicella sporogenes]
MIKVRVPATTANVGPGFDCLGIALNLYNNFYFEEIEEGLKIEGTDREFQNEDNLVFQSMKKTFDKIGYKYKGIKILIEDNIPISRGLGSSAACIVGGVVGANRLAGDVLSKEELLKIATEIEGHPDNVAPALFGGMTAAIYENGKVYFSKINITEGLKFYALVPNFRLSTEKARSVLPQNIPYKDGVYNVGRTALLISSLVNGEFHLLREACKDKLHQNYRGKLIDDYDEIIKICEDIGVVGVFLSGAGPTIMALDKEGVYIKEKFEREFSRLNATWKVYELSIDFYGAKVEELQL